MITDFNAAVRWFTYWVIVILAFWMLLGYIMLATGHHKGEEAWMDMNKRVCKSCSLASFSCCRSLTGSEMTGVN